VFIAATAPLTLPALNYLFVYWMGHAAYNTLIAFL
jgi:hypothetical protein